MTVPEIWPGQDRGGKKKKRKKKKNEFEESHKASPTEIANKNNEDKNENVFILLKHFS